MTDRLFVHRNGHSRVVGTGFSWWCFFFGLIHGLVIGAWLQFMTYVLLNIVLIGLLVGGVPAAFVWFLGFGANVYFSFKSNEWIADSLRERGYEEMHAGLIEDRHR